MMACGPDLLAPKTCHQKPDDSSLACTLDVQECPDGSFVGRDANNGCAFAPCEVDCEVCPGGFFDGCNHCACNIEGGPICTMMACGPDMLAPKTCNEEAPPGDHVVCTLDAQICPDGTAVGRDPANGCTFFPCPRDDDDDDTVGCDTCECGFNDGCNDCHCADDGSMGCTKRFCFWQGTPSCLDCPSSP
jgi:hypothetical protein